MVILLLLELVYPFYNVLGLVFADFINGCHKLLEEFASLYENFSLASHVLEEYDFPGQ